MVLLSFTCFIPLLGQLGKYKKTNRTGRVSNAAGCERSLCATSMVASSDHWGLNFFWPVIRIPGVEPLPDQEHVVLDPDTVYQELQIVPPNLEPDWNPNSVVIRHSPQIVLLAAKPRACPF
jgi:hypothetical protein